MTLKWKIPTNQSKWIDDILPPNNGNYLVKYKINATEFKYARLEYTCVAGNGLWQSRTNFVYPKVSILAWWDEYNYYGEIRKLKIKFPNDREENK